MGHVVRIQSREQLIAAIGVLNDVEGMWSGVGTSAAPILLLTDKQYNALVEAGVVQANGKEAKPRGKKAAAKKTKS